MENTHRSRSTAARIRWVIKEIQYVCSKGIIDTDSAARLTRFYEERLLNYKRILLYIFGTFGVVLIGSGILLVIAQYWNTMPRSVKLVLSIVVLITAQLLVARFCLYTKKQRRFIDESLGVFWALAFGGMLYLVGDVLNLPRAYRTFLLLWSLGVLPICYLQKSLATLFVYTGLVIAWLATVSTGHGVTIPVYGLYAAVLPFYFLLVNRKRGSVRQILLKYWVAATTIISLALLMEYPFTWFLIPTYAGLVSMLYLAGEIRETGEERYLARPFSLLGLFGICIHSIVLSIEDTWLFFRIDTIASHLSIPSFSFIEDVLFLPLLFCACSMALSVYILLKKKNMFHLVPALYCPLVIVLNYISIWMDTTFIAIFPWLANLYTLLFASLYVYRGFKKQSLFHMNVGSFFILAVIVIRLFGYEIDFWLRGISFIFIGSAYVLLNFKLITTKRKSVSI